MLVVAANAADCQYLGRCAQPGLPLSGAELWVIVALGIVLIGVGIALRWR